ncbi:MAG: coproporphyrinogen dehydrogenase HemZ [Firmicutes bacterium]|nr:coproporphyrinogen dehydrogenase HemZ [Bacillota bacterium]
MKNLWGDLTGVKPVKLTRELFKGNPYNGKKPHEKDEVLRILTEERGVSPVKAALLVEIYEYQQKVLQGDDYLKAGLYIGIPFCPTRCLYCSFTSNQRPYSEIERYLEALISEIEYVGRRLRESGMGIETIYIGGGTPTTLDVRQLNRLLDAVLHNMDLCKLREFTLEAGRPDTITAEKLQTARDHGVDRISINPQSMKERTLELIGRSHSPKDIYKAFEIAHKSGIPVVNCDLIAGLPEESVGDFEKTLETIIGLRPSNITVHTLALKRASRLIEQDPEYHETHSDVVAEMIALSHEMLRDAAFRPYYLYRLKRMAGALENTGWCREGTAGIYNIRIMDEQQSIIALGAGGMSKVFFPEENRLERVPNVNNYEVYIDRLQEMLERKEQGLFSMIPEIYKQTESLRRR